MRLGSDQPFNAVVMRLKTYKVFETLQVGCTLSQLKLKRFKIQKAGNRRLFSEINICYCFMILWITASSAVIILTQ